MTAAKFEIVVYSSMVGFDPVQDQSIGGSISAAAERFGGEASGSGYDLIDRQRDYRFLFPSEAQARSFASLCLSQGLIKEDFDLDK